MNNTAEGSVITNEGTDCISSTNIVQQTLAQKTVWSAWASICTLFGRLVVQIMIARMLGPDGIGRIAYLMLLIEFTSVLSNFGLPCSLTRYLAELYGQKKPEQAITFAQWVYIRYLTLVLVGSVTVGFLFFNSSQYAGIELALPVLMLLFLVRSLQAINRANLAGQQRFDLLASINIVSTVALIAGVSIGVYFYGVTGVLIGYVVGAFYPALYSFSSLRDFSPKKKIDAELRRRVRKFAINTWLALIVSAFVWSRIEIFFLERYRDIHEVAMFTVGLTFVMMIQTVTGLFMGAFLPHFSQLIAERKRTAIQIHYETATKLISLVAFPLSLGGAAIMPVLLPLVYGRDFLLAVPNSMVLMTSSVLVFSGIGSSLIYAMERPKFIVLCGFSGACLSITFCFIIIPIFGAWGAVWSRLLIQFLMVSLGTWYITKRLDFSFPFSALMRIFIAASLCGISAWCIIRFVPFPIVALWVAVFLGAIVYIISIKIFHVLNSYEIRQLNRIINRLPDKFRRPLEIILKWICFER